jgi:hypothetical protein
MGRLGRMRIRGKMGRIGAMSEGNIKKTGWPHDGPSGK